jgi:endoglucanase
MIKFFSFLFILIFAFPQGSKADEPNGWEVFKTRFISKDGRVIDHVQDQISHSEGQGFAMLLAARHDDPTIFALLWRWTQDNIQVRKLDHLFAWKWGERAPGKWGVIDLNNATDGDTLIALALLEGAVRWKNEDYRTSALEIIKSIHKHLVFERDGRLFLLPGYYGFIKEKGLILNPSYMIFPAYAIFAKYHEPKFWQKLRRDSLDILARCVFTRLMLPADWIFWKPQGPSVYAEKSEVFGFEAIRVLLYLAWDHSMTALPKIRETLHVIDQLGFIPCSVNLARNTISLNEAPAGFYAVFARTAFEIGEKEHGQALWRIGLDKLGLEKDNYYSHVLYLLAKIDMKS